MHANETLLIGVAMLYHTHSAFLTTALKQLCFITTGLQNGNMNSAVPDVLQCHVVVGQTDDVTAHGQMSKEVGEAAAGKRGRGLRMPSGARSRVIYISRCHLSLQLRGSTGAT